MARDNIRFCTAADGVRIAYSVSGKGAPLVKAANWLTHLEFDSRSALRGHWARELSRDHAYVRYDSRGCGLSDRSPAEISFEAWVLDLEAVIDAVGLERCSVIGLSQGALIAAAYAARHPERVSHLVAVGAFVKGELAQGGAERIEKRLLYYKLAELGWGRSDNEEFRQVYLSHSIPDASSAERESFDELQRVALDGKTAVRCLQAKDQIDMTAVLPHVACPCLVLHARHDVSVPFEDGRHFATLVPGARFVPLEGRNHLLLESQPAWSQFLEEMRAFLPGSRTLIPGLTAREAQLIELLARGLDNHQIAAHLELSEKTVRNMVSSVLAKLGVESRAAAIVRAREAGYGVDSHA